MSLHKVDAVSESTAGAGVTITSRKVGKPPNSVGNGTVDDYSAISTALAGFSAGDLYELGAGTYRLATSLTISCGFKPMPGVKLKPDSGKVVTINTPSLDVGAWQWIDPTSAGTFSFPKVRRFRPEWFGVVGDGSTDDLAALNYMIANVPDYSTIVFSANLQMVISNELIITGRRSLTLISEAGSQPDGGGAAFFWGGPSHILTGADAAITSGTTDLTTVAGRFSADMVGQRIIVAFAGPQNAGLMAKITAFVSSTHVVLDTAASSTQSGRTYIIGPAVVYFRSCDSCKITGFSIPLAAPGSGMGYDAYIASGSNTLNLKAFGQLTSGDIGKMIRVDGAGPAGAELITTITNVSGSVGGAQVVTLAATASTTITTSQLTTYIVGRSATSLPARYGILSDESGISSTGTHCEFSENRITTPSPVDYEWYGIAISIATNQNQEYHTVAHNSILGGGTLEMHGDGTTSGVATTIGTPNIVASNGFFTPSQTGRRLRIANAGGTGVALDGKVITVTDSTHIVASVNAGVTVTNERIFIGEGKSYGVTIGNTPNSKGIEIQRRNLLNSHKWGIWIQAGSAHSSTTSFTANESDYRIDGSSEPMLFDMDNSEQSLRHLDAQSHADNLTFIAPRLGNQQIQPNGGYWHFDSNSNTVVIISPKQDDKMYPGSVMYKHLSSNNRIRLIEPKYYNAPNPTMADLGITQALIDATGATVYVEGHRQISDAPADVFTMSALVSGTPQTGAPGIYRFGGQIKVANGLSFGTPRNVGGNTTLDLRDGMVLASAGGASITITLPSPTSAPTLRIIRTDGSGNTLTVTPPSGTINGAANITIVGQWTAKTIVSDGTNWYAF